MQPGFSETIEAQTLRGQGWVLLEEWLEFVAPSRDEQSLLQYIAPLAPAEVRFS